MPSTTSGEPRPTDVDPMPDPPREPALEECCGSGCDPCVFDRYDLERHAYREALKAWKARHPEFTDVDPAR